MSADPALLIHRYLEGLLEGDEVREFNERVRAEPEFRAMLARMSYDAVALRELLGASEERASAAPSRLPAWMRFGAAVPVAAAAVLLGIVAMVVLARPRPAPFAALASGRIAVEGIESDRPVPGAKTTVLGDAPALIRFQGGATAELAPASEAVVREGTLELSRGAARITGPLRVVDPCAQVRSRTAQFRVERRGKDSLFVAVIEGEVEIDRDGLRTTLRDSRVIAVEKRGAENPMWGAYERRLGRASLTLEQALAAASREVADGVACRAELEEEDGSTTFAVKLAKGASVVEVDIDPASGRVVDRDTEAGDLSWVSDAMPLARAVELALQDVPGRAVAAAIGRRTVAVTIVAGERLIRLRLDARTGGVVDREPADQED